MISILSVIAVEDRRERGGPVLCWSQVTVRCAAVLLCCQHWDEKPTSPGLSAGKLLAPLRGSSQQPSGRVSCSTALDTGNYLQHFLQTLSLQTHTGNNNFTGDWSSREERALITGSHWFSIGETKLKVVESSGSVITETGSGAG